MKIELDFPQVPEGWRFVGIEKPKKGHGGAMSELNAFIDKYILELEQIRDEVKTFKEHAVEVLAGEMQKKYVGMMSLGYIHKGDLDMETMRAEAKQLLGVR
jgi:hypothetical protein